MKRRRRTRRPVGVLVACRQCGARGYETPDDPAPGLCPACFDRGMDWATLRALDHLAAGLRDAALRAQCQADLETAGMRPAAARDFIEVGWQMATTQGRMS